MLSITPIYVGLLALLFVWLSLRVSLMRLKGFSEDSTHAAPLKRAMRAQGNAAEYIPLGLIALAVLEMQGAPAWLIHLFGVLLLGGRIGHFIGFDLAPKRLLRQYSMVATYGMLCFSGIAILYFSAAK